MKCDMCGYENKIIPEDLKIETYRPEWEDGNKPYNTTYAVRITYIPTGTVVKSEIEQAQILNKEECIRQLEGMIKQLDYCPVCGIGIMKEVEENE